MTQSQQIGTVATAIFTEHGWTRVVYHDTPVVKFNHQVIILDSGGWETVTTKARMNQASQQFDLGYKVYQKDHAWHVDYAERTMKFFDGIRLARNDWD